MDVVEWLMLAREVTNTRRKQVGPHLGDPVESLKKLKEEVKELKEAIKHGHNSPPRENLDEMWDVIHAVLMVGHDLNFSNDYLARGLFENLRKIERRAGILEKAGD